MSGIWPKFTKEHPCPSCKHSDWTCRHGDRVYICMRSQSPYPSTDGGWYHHFSEKPLTLPPAKKYTAPRANLNCSRLIMEWAQDTALESLQMLSESLGVSLDSLACLNAVYAKPYHAWAFPMRDGYGNPVGIRLRAMDGRKWAVTGSRGGIFLPEVEPQKTVYITEGPTDTAAALTIGLYAIGRPQCNAGGSDLKTACNRLGVQKAVLVADNDPKRRPDGKYWNPGVEGAKRLAAEIKLPTAVLTLPAKDMREFVRSGGSKIVIESLIRNAVWNRGIDYLSLFSDSHGIG
jgi:hypothetical protein